MVKAIEMPSIEDIVKESEVMSYSENKRTFKYELNAKSATAKLIKGAKRIPFEVIEKASSSNLVFSTGAWNHVVQPSVGYFDKVKGDKKCTVGNITVSIASVKTGKEINGKHIDTQIIFFANRDKVVCHFYNTTQLIMCNGHGYANLIEIFLKPFFVIWYTEFNVSSVRD